MVISTLKKSPIQSFSYIKKEAKIDEHRLKSKNIFLKLSTTDPCLSSEMEANVFDIF